jgi:hypothetical protein
MDRTTSHQPTGTQPAGAEPAARSDRTNLDVEHRNGRRPGHAATTQHQRQPATAQRTGSEATTARDRHHLDTDGAPPPVRHTGDTPTRGPATRAEPATRRRGQPPRRTTRRHAPTQSRPATSTSPPTTGAATDRVRTRPRAGVEPGSCFRNGLVTSPRCWRRSSWTSTSCSRGVAHEQPFSTVSASGQGSVDCRPSEAVPPGNADGRTRVAGLRGGSGRDGSCSVPGCGRGTRSRRCGSMLRPSGVLPWAVDSRARARHPREALAVSPCHSSGEARLRYVDRTRSGGLPRTEGFTAPEYRAKAYHCPHCGVFAHQNWSKASFTTPYPSDRVVRSQCQSCGEMAIWVDEQLVFPSATVISPPNQDLEEAIQADYREAASIVERSPRGAAALLRLAIQKMCRQLHLPGKNLNSDVATLVSQGTIPETIQQALDVVRVVGNNAVHPGELSLEDDRDTAVQLFELVNLIAEGAISQPKRVAKLYERLPSGARAAISKRDDTG